MPSKKQQTGGKEFKVIKVGNSENRSDGDRQHYRIGKILNRLEEGPVHLRTLATEFGVVKRSIERDIDRIELYGYNIITPKKGWRQFAPGVSLKKGKLDIQQQSALIILNEVSKNLGSSMQQSFGTLFKHLMEADPADSVIVPVMPKIINTKEIPFIDQIEAAISDNRKLKIQYNYEAKGEIVPRTICPVKILISEGNAYVLTISERFHGSPITYRIDRIKTLEDTPEKFSPPDNLNELLEKARSIWGIMPEKERTTLIRLRVTEWAREYFRYQEIIGGQKIIPQDDGSYIYEAKIGRLMEIVPHILRWMPYVKVLEPKELKETVKYRINEYLKK